MIKDKVLIIGVSAEGLASLNPSVRRLVRGAEVLYGGKRLLKLFPFSSSEKIPITDNLEAVSHSIKANLGRKKIVVLASGDPNFYGIANYLRQTIGKEFIDIIPNVSSMQLAFARIQESWEDAVFTSVHSRSMNRLAEIVRTNDKVCILTDEKNNPAVIARELRHKRIDHRLAYVCQDLGSEKEQIIAADLESLEGQAFSPLNILILIRDKKERKESESYGQLLGISEDCFSLRSDDTSLITKLEIRAVSLAKLRLTDNSILWDIGAGSGSVSIEASMLARSGHIYAIEKNQADADIIWENVLRFKRSNITVFQSTAPDGMRQLPAPSAVFIGGSGGRMAAILDLVCKKLQAGGRIVINLATLENLQTAGVELLKHGFEYETVLLNISRSKAILDLTRLEALNPVFIVTGWRKSEKDI